MNEQGKPVVSETHRGVALSDVLAVAALGAFVLTGAFGEPKLPPFRGD